MNVVENTWQNRGENVEVGDISPLPSVLVQECRAACLADN